MAFVVCIVPVSPMRKESNHKAEMVSQLLFGEMAEVLEEGNVFIKIKCLYDGYEGWCQSNQITQIDDSEAIRSKKILTSKWISVIELNGSPMKLPLGCSLDRLTGEKIGKYTLHYLDNGWDVSNIIYSWEAIHSFCLQYLNTPYLWGGRSVFGIDCSGFVQQVFAYFNKKLPRDAYEQAREGEVVGFLQEVKGGELAFFDNEEGHINHVGILMDTETIIHASGKVRIDKIDNMGIVNSETGVRTHMLRIIKRI